MFAPVAIDVAAIRHSPKKRPIRNDKVGALVDSIREIGMRTPITVRAPHVDREVGDSQQYEIVAGHHRFEAIRALGYVKIDCYIVAADDPDAAMWEIDENLVRAELTKMELADHLVRRKAEYLKRHPETRNGGLPGKAGGGKVAKNDNLASFAKDTADKTGLSKRTIERGVRRGERIAPDVRQDIVGTKLDTGASLDRLAKMEPDEQRKTAAAGELPPAPAAENPPPANGSASVPDGPAKCRPEDDDNVIDLVQILHGNLSNALLKETAAIARRIGARFTIAEVFVSADEGDWG